WESCVPRAGIEPASSRSKSRPLCQLSYRGTQAMSSSSRRASSCIEDDLDLIQLQLLAAERAKLAQEMREVRVLDRDAVHEFRRGAKIRYRRPRTRGRPSSLDRVNAVTRTYIVDHVLRADGFAGQHQPRLRQIPPNQRVRVDAAARRAVPSCNVARHQAHH